jgi:hypothetical protein
MGGEAEHLKRLRRADLPPAEVARILADKEARRFHSVRLALAAHRNTPRADAISLVQTLFWRGLAHLSTNALVHPEIRRAADRQLQQRLPEMALAERVDLARSVGRGSLPAVRQDPDPRVLTALLDNRFAIEADVVALAASRRTGPETLASVARHPRWGRRPGVRDALLANPALPEGVAEILLEDATRERLSAVSEREDSPPAIRAAAQRVLAQRTQQD